MELSPKRQISNIQKVGKLNRQQNSIIQSDGGLMQIQKNIHSPRKDVLDSIKMNSHEDMVLHGSNSSKNIMNIIKKRGSIPSSGIISSQQEIGQPNGKKLLSKREKNHLNYNYNNLQKVIGEISNRNDGSDELILKMKKNKDQDNLSIGSNSRMPKYSKSPYEKAHQLKKAYNGYGSQSRK